MEIEENPAITQATSNPLNFAVASRIVVDSLSRDTFRRNHSGRKPFYDASAIGEFPIKTIARGDPTTLRDRLAVHGVGLCRMERRGWSNAMFRPIIDRPHRACAQSAVA
jgi:hypothetical protein